MGFQFRRKYLLPPNDPRFLDLTEEDMMADLIAHDIVERGDDGGEEYEDEDVDLDEMLERLESGEDWEDVING